MSRKIKFIANVVRWFDRLNGNTYHSVEITRCRDGKRCYAEFQYGYGSAYVQSALVAMSEAKLLPVKYRGSMECLNYDRECGYPIHWNVSDGLKRDCVANGSGFFNG